MKKRLLVFLVAMLVLCLVAVGCGSKQAPPGNQQGEQKGEEEQLTMKVGADVTFPPFEMMENGVVTGFDIDLIKAIAEVENIKIDGEIQTMDFQGLIPAIQTGSIDVAVAGITIREDRAKQVDFSKPYYHSGITLLVRADSDITGVDDLVGKTIAVKLGTTGDIMFSEKEGIQIKRFNNIDEAYRELVNGGADAVPFDNPIHQHYINTAGKGKVKVVGELLTGEDYGIAVSKNRPELLEKINSGLDKLIESGKYEEIYKKYFSDEYGLVNK
ncbi:MAG TPA: basic amino acid ABC transporter substrate-binding protein [Peptococcaceae bacterium]|nr:basic amino acid ABC transporter substrate-binding protein [Peptococcaceae bacterium]